MLSLSYHEYEGLALNPDEKARLQADLGPTHHMILRNHGLLTVGRTVSDAFVSMYSLQRACEIQVMAQAGGSSQLIGIPQKVLDTVPEFVRLVTRGAGTGLVWPALLRKMDRLDAGYRE
jgi:ribulose-5-phosphate 4-epimerase/fuculose-1-phosphate aldolase